MGLLSDLNSFAGHQNAARRNEIAGQRLEIEQQRLDFQRSAWHTEHTQAALVDRADVVVADLSALAGVDPVSAAVMSQAVLQTLPDPECLHKLEYKRSIRAAQSRLAGFWLSLTPEGQADASAFMQLSLESLQVRIRADMASGAMAKAEREAKHARLLATVAPVAAAGFFFVAIICFGVVIASPASQAPQRRPVATARSKGKAPPPAAASSDTAADAGAAGVVTCVLSGGWLVAWGVLHSLARDARSRLTKARDQSEGARRAAFDFWADAYRGQRLNALVARWPRLRDVPPPTVRV